MYSAQGVSPPEAACGQADCLTPLQLERAVLGKSPLTLNHPVFVLCSHFELLLSELGTTALPSLVQWGVEGGGVQEQERAESPSPVHRDVYHTFQKCVQQEQPEKVLAIPPTPLTV